MGIVWANWQAGVSRKVRIGVWGVVILSSLWYIVAWAAGFDTWDFWLVGPVLVWFPVLVGLSMVVYIAQQRIIARPMSFCLPGYRECQRRLSLATGIPAGVASALFVLALFPYGSYDELRRMVFSEAGPRVVVTPVRCLQAAAGFSGGMAMFAVMASVRLIFPKRAWLVVAFLLPVLFVLGMPVIVAGFWSPLRIWPAVILLAVCTCALVGLRLGRMPYVVQAHRSIIASVGEGRDIELKRMGRAWVADVFLREMERCGPSQEHRYLWGSLCRAFGPLLSRWRLNVTMLLIVLPVGCYNHWVAGAMVFVTFAFVVAQMELPATSALLLPAGRRKRESATVITVQVASLLLAGAGTIVALVSQSIVPLMPWSGVVGYNGLDFGSGWLPSLLVPGLVGFRLLGYLAPGVLQAVGRSAAGLAMVAILLLDSALLRWIDVSRGLLFSGALVSSWVFFLWVLRHISTRGCLVRSTPVRLKVFGVRE